MKIALIIESCGEATFGGLIITPKSITETDIPRLYAEYDADHRKAMDADDDKHADEEFADWLIRRKRCKEEQVAFAIVGPDWLPKASVKVPAAVKKAVKKAAKKAVKA